jgi:hypothetical protein
MLTPAMSKPLTIFLTTWNTGLQGSKAQSQDLTSWLLPVLQRTSQDASGQIAPPDLYAIGVQELLPVNLARELLFLLRQTGIWGRGGGAADRLHACFVSLSRTTLLRANGDGTDHRAPMLMLQSLV